MAGPRPRHFFRSFFSCHPLFVCSPQPPTFVWTLSSPWRSGRRSRHARGHRPITPAPDHFPPCSPNRPSSRFWDCPRDLAGGSFSPMSCRGLNARDIEFLSGLSFNFTSLLSMLLGHGHGSRCPLWPRSSRPRQAAALRGPQWHGSWELPPPGRRRTIRFESALYPHAMVNAVGMAAFFRQFSSSTTPNSTSEGLQLPRHRLHPGVR